MSDASGNAGSEDAPAWFRNAVMHPSKDFTCDSGGTRIHYRAWQSPDPSAPAILFVHGFRAHSHWWDFIAPFFVSGHRVFALDLAGMGDSGRRAQYDLTSFSRDIVAVIDSAGLAPAILVGHSFGGSCVLRACIDHPDRMRRAMILDSAVYLPGHRLPKVTNGVGRPTPYPDKSAILSRYRLIPEQPAEPYLRCHIAEHSIRQVEGGWRWKFDPKLVAIHPERDGMALLGQVKVPFEYVCGELSLLITPERALEIASVLTSSGRRTPLILPGAHHHLMLDQPLALIATLGKLLAQPNGG